MSFIHCYGQEFSSDVLNRWPEGVLLVPKVFETNCHRFYLGENVYFTFIFEGFPVYKILCQLLYFSFNYCNVCAKKGRKGEMCK